MRLIDAQTLQIHEFLSEPDIPPFAILSHTWGDEECTLQQMENPNVKSRSGYAKILLCCQQALRDGLQWAWVDTCCIDKTSTAELSEAINSMFRWYRNAAVCYAYLLDIKGVHQLGQSRWFTRGWTLQELVAPHVIHFYDSEWAYIGSKSDLRHQIQEITGIEEDVLHTGNFEHVSIAKKMSWAANRQTTRAEDQSYCLLGLFDVNMPLLYGEGNKAFRRLQEEIMKVSDDQSLFAWGLPEKLKTLTNFVEERKVDSEENRSFKRKIQLYGLFATSPSDFTNSGRIRVLEVPPSIPPIISNSGVRIELQVYRSAGLPSLAAIFCTIQGHFDSYLAFPLHDWGERWAARERELFLLPARNLAEPHSGGPYCALTPCLIKAPSTLYSAPPPQNLIKISRVTGGFEEYYTLEDVVCAPGTSFCTKSQTLTLMDASSPDSLDKIQAVLLFTPRRGKDIHNFYSLFDGTLWQSLLFEHPFVEVQDNFSESSMKHIGAGKAFALTIIQPAFAVLIGGTIKTLWVEAMVVLDDNRPDVQFQKMADWTGLIDRCMPKKHILSHVRQEKDKTRNIKPHIGQTSVTGQVAQYKCWWRFKEGDVGHGPWRKDGTIYVHASVQECSSNLVERSNFLFVEINGQRERRMDRPNWWTREEDGLHKPPLPRREKP